MQTSKEQSINLLAGVAWSLSEELCAGGFVVPGLRLLGALTSPQAQALLRDGNVHEWGVGADLFRTHLRIAYWLLTYTHDDHLAEQHISSAVFFSFVAFSCLLFTGSYFARMPPYAEFFRDT